MLVLVQVIFFDFEHRLILDRVMFPAMALARAREPVRAALVGRASRPGLGAGLLFFVLAAGGSALLKRRRWASAT